MKFLFTKGHKYAVGKLNGNYGKVRPPHAKPPSQKGKIRTLETRIKMRNAHKGEKCYRWKGGLTHAKLALRHSLEYRLWRTAVFVRDNYTCIWCGKRGGALNVDHIKSFSHYPELRFAIDNGRTLCVPCHKTTDNFAGKGYYKK